MHNINNIGKSQRCLRGKNIYLRPPKYDELEYIKWLWLDEKTMKEVGGSINLSDEQADKWYKKVVSPGSETDYYCLIFDLNNLPVGEVSFHKYNAETKTGELNIKIAFGQRRKGYFKEAILLFLGYYFFELGGEVMEDLIATNNTIGQQVLLKYGFEHDLLGKDGFLVRITKKKFRELYNEDEYFMRLAIDLAYQSRQNGEDPFGAVLIYDGTLMHQSEDKSIYLSDPTAHAEVSVIREYCQMSKKFSLEGFTLYSSTEPCVMCSGAIHWARISKVVFSVSQEMLWQFSGGRSKLRCNEILNMGRSKVEVVGPFLSEEGLSVYDGYNFVPKLERHKLRFSKYYK